MRKIFSFSSSSSAAQDSEQASAHARELQRAEVARQHQEWIQGSAGFGHGAPSFPIR